MEIKKTITSIFMVPTLKFPKNKLKDNGFINGFMFDLERKDTHCENNVYLLFQPKNLDRFREFLDEEYERTKNIVEDYDYKNGYVVIVYQLNKDFNSDFELIKSGKYSKTSPEFQKLFPKLMEINMNGLIKNEISLQYRIFNKTKDLVEFWEDKLNIDFSNLFGEDFEVWEGFDLKRETLNINNYV